MTRIGHKKSRNGCSRCKQRKIKCDERRPCGACIKWQLCCSLLSLLDHGSSTGQANPNPRSSKQGGDIPSTVICRRTSSALEADSQRPPLASRPLSHVAILVPGPKFEQPSSWTTDLGLMNHYTSHTSATLPGASDRVWQIEIPREAVAYPFLMHQILATSAFHLASLNPSHGQEHLSRAFQHQHHAICGIKAEVSNVTASNCHALFAASSLLFIGAFAASATTMEKTHQQEVDDMLDVFTLVRGVSGILSSSRDDICQGILGEFMQCDPCLGSTGLLSLLLERLPQIRKSLDADGMNPEAKALVEEAIFGLGESMGRASAATPELNVAILWPMTLKDGFLALLRAHHPAALVVAAHYCTVLHAVGSHFWFLRGWGCRLVTAIAHSLGPAWHESIQWPMDYIRSGIAS